MLMWQDMQMYGVERTRTREITIRKFFFRWMWMFRPDDIWMAELYECMRGITTFWDQGDGGLNKGVGEIETFLM